MTMLIFPFQATLAGVPNQQSVLLFAGTQLLDPQAIQQAYQDWTESHVAPPHTFLLAADAEIAKLLQREPCRRGAIPGLERLSAWGTLHLCGFDRDGTVREWRLTGEGEPYIETSGSISATVEQAIACFVDRRALDGDVVVPAPCGFYFEKLSGRYASHFIRTEALLETTLHIELLALATLPAFSAWHRLTERQRSLETQIYIDTMAIWPVAEKLCQLHRAASDADPYKITSFQSYEGLAQWDPVPAPAFSILSASTSGSLAQAVDTRTQRGASHVVTLLGLADSSAPRLPASTPANITTLFRVPRVLVGAASLDGLRKVFEPSVSPLPLGAESIRLFGERFIAQGARPKLVRLAHGSLDGKMKQSLARWGRANAIVAARRRQDGRSFWSISFDLDRLHHTFVDGDAAVLRPWLRNNAPRGEIAIIYPSAYGAEAPAVTRAAERLALAVQAILLEDRPGADIPILQSQELNGSATSQRIALHSRGVIVVAPVIGGGFGFKQISAHLRRLQPTGPRLFLSFVALTDSRAQFKILENDLTLNEDDGVYRFRCKESYPIGRLGIAAQWDKDLDVLTCLLENHAAACAPALDALTRRRDALLDGQGLPSDQTFLPTLRGTSLSLTTGFAMWAGSDGISGENMGAAVLLTMAALLEAARDERTTGNGETALKTGLFQQTLIDPEMFTRYNDGVIQAALLRAAYPVELNYSMSRQASADMGNLLMKWFELAGEPAGDGVAEFLFALLTGKLRLQPDDLQRVLQATTGLPGWLGAFGAIVRERI